MRIPLELPNTGYKEIEEGWTVNNYKLETENFIDIDIEELVYLDMVSYDNDEAVELLVISLRRRDYALLRFMCTEVRHSFCQSFLYRCLRGRFR